MHFPPIAIALLSTLALVTSAPTNRSPHCSPDYSDAVDETPLLDDGQIVDAGHRYYDTPFHPQRGTYQNIQRRNPPDRSEPPLPPDDPEELSRSIALRFGDKSKLVATEEQKAQNREKVRKRKEGWSAEQWDTFRKNRRVIDQRHRDKVKHLKLEQQAKGPVEQPPADQTSPPKPPRQTYPIRSKPKKQAKGRVKQQPPRQIYPIRPKLEQQAEDPVEQPPADQTSPPQPPPRSPRSYPLQFSQEAEGWLLQGRIPSTPPRSPPLQVSQQVVDDPN
jgi:hypothetical protein